MKVTECPWRLAHSGCAKFVSLFLLAFPVGAAELLKVDNIDALVIAVGRADPGTVIEIASGKYTLEDKITLEGRGSPAAPVTVRPQAIGRVTFTGPGSFNIGQSSWLVVDGLILAYEPSTLSVSNSDHVRLTRLKIRYQYSAQPRRSSSDARLIHWVRFRDGIGHRLDHSEIGPHPGGLGVTVLADNNTHDLMIDHNYFHDRPRDGRNGAETIRLGTGGSSDIDAVIESNLFENCDGEAELISIKSNGNTVKDNTFRNNQGQLVIRDGSDISIIGNYFIARGTSKKVGGIRVQGENVRITGNYFQDMPGPVLESVNGDRRIVDSAADNRNPFGGYRQSVDLVFSGNVVVDSESVGTSAPSSILPIIRAGKERLTGANLPPKHWDIQGNTFSTSRPVIAAVAGTTIESVGNTFLRGSNRLQPADLARRQRLHGVPLPKELTPRDVGPGAE